LRKSDGRAVAWARIGLAFESLLSAAMAQLYLHYAARIGALTVCRRGDQAAAIAALRQEREAALARLQSDMTQEKETAMRTARETMKGRHYHAGSLPVMEPRRKVCRPVRPDRLKRRTERLIQRPVYPKP
jgi:hypothetical protein